MWVNWTKLSQHIRKYRDKLHCSFPSSDSKRKPDFDSCWSIERRKLVSLTGEVSSFHEQSFYRDSLLETSYWMGFSSIFPMRDTAIVWNLKNREFLEFCGFEFRHWGLYANVSKGKVQIKDEDTQCCCEGFMRHYSFQTWKFQYHQKTLLFAETFLVIRRTFTSENEHSVQRSVLRSFYVPFVQNTNIVKRQRKRCVATETTLETTET